MNGRTVLRRGGALVGVTGLAVAVAGASVLAGPVEPDPATGRPLPLTARAATTVCPGPETLSVPEGAEPVDPGGDTRVRAVVAARDEAGDVDGVLGPIGDQDDERDDEQTDEQTDEQDDEQDGEQDGEQAGEQTAEPAAPQPLTASGALAGTASLLLAAAGAATVQARTPVGSQAPLTAGVQATLAREGDLRGLVTTPCSAVSDLVWLVGSGTGEGRRGRLLLSNPTPAPATVDVRVLTPDGPVDPPNGQGVVVPSGSQVALLLDALEPGAQATAVRVLAREGRVAATLHDSLLRGLVAGGTDDVSPAAAPATRQVVPGLAVQAPAVANGTARLPADPADPGAVAVRVGVPGAEAAVVRVYLVGADGTAQLPEGVVDVAAGAVVDVPVTGVPDGSWSAVVESDVPVVAGALVGRAVARSELAGTPEGVAADVPPAELAWAAATEPLATGLVALPQDVPARLVLVAPGEAGSVRITPVTADGRRAAADVAAVPAGRTVSVVVPAAAAGLLVEPEGGPLHGAVTLEIDDPAGPVLSVLPIDPPPASAQTRRPVSEDPHLR